MATISDYPSLVAAILAYSHRANLATNVDYLIQAAQEQIETDIPIANVGSYLRYQEGIYTSVAVDANGNAPIPVDWLGPRNLTIAGFNLTKQLLFKAAGWIYGKYPFRSADGFPTFVARDDFAGGSSWPGGNPPSSSTEVLIFGPYPNQAYTVQGTYYQKAAALSSGNTTNWIVLQAPMMLHAACMVQVGLFIPDRNLVATWQPIYQQRLQALVDKCKSEAWSAGTAQVARL